MIINASIEARMTSSRLPGKVLMPIMGKPVLELLIERVKNTKYIDTIIVATTDNKDDDPIVELCHKLGVDYFRGSEPDVLERVYFAHKEFQSDIVVELTGDNPLIDSALIDYSILSYIFSDYDYVSTALSSHFPYGQAVEVFSFELLEYLNHNALTEYDREHVTPHIYQNEDKFKILSLNGSKKHHSPNLRQTLDTKSDFEMICEVFTNLYPSDPNFDMIKSIDIMKKIHS